ncbi:MAG TPA: YqgE/AlgH family protein [Isosphaeraceae bacterium]|jgi:putative transcriptional regulator|nr:YqgE/AlgH family protein [Isosphaeraceae bacterium]
MDSIAGQFLIATPKLVAPLFERSVLLMLDHSPEGAMGVILNKPIETTVADLAGKVFEEGFDWEKPLHLGGPVAGPLIVIHTIAELADREVVPGVFGTLEAAKAQEVIGRRPEPSFVIANYSGWGPGQLEDEFDRGSWLALPATTEQVFEIADDDPWDTLLRAANALKLTADLGLPGIPDDPRAN